MRKGIIGLSPKIMVELLLALFIFIIVFSYTGTGKEKGWDVVDLMNDAMDKGWPWGCENVGVRTFDEFKNYMYGVYDNCKTNDKCGTEGCLSMELDLGPAGIGDGTYSRVDIDVVKATGLTSFTCGGFLCRPYDVYIFCDTYFKGAKNRRSGDEIDVSSKNIGNISNAPIYVSGQRSEPCGDEEVYLASSPAIMPPYFYVADGSKVRILAKKRDGIDLNIRVDGGQYLSYA